jgi:UDP-N-acetylmuramoyl-L-alanyl-D-glutamate--2,6-diaminopimelate ligase
MIHAIFLAAGIPVASLSSVRLKFGEREEPNPFKMTMPGRFFIQKFLHEAKKRGMRFVVLEVTSEGIKQFRHRYIPFAAAVLTNLTPEHIESHGGFENYKRAKGELFRALQGRGVSVINGGDPSAPYFISFPAQKTLTYRLEGEATLVPARYEITKDGITLEFSEGIISSPLKGRFNAENMLAAITVGEAFGVSFDAIKTALSHFTGVPGRMEEIKAKNFRVIVDYAFTPNALRQVYQTLKPEARHLICVLGGTGGGRDKWKRPELGKIAAELCDRVIITNEDPYEEEPRAIMNDVARGAPQAEIIEDRGEAIQKALKLAGEGDVIIITGKGSEQTMAVRGGRQIPWDDRATVRKALETLKEI